MQVLCDTTPGDLTYWTLEHILFIDGTLVIDLLMQWERMCRTTKSFESVMCFQYPKTLDLEISWTFRLGEMTSSVTDLDFMWALCGQVVLSAHPQDSAGSESEAGRWPRSLPTSTMDCSRGQKIVKAKFQTPFFWAWKFPREFLQLIFKDIWQILIVYSFQGIVKCPPFDSLAFGHGARVCLGKQLADYEGRLVIAQARAASLEFCTCRSCH